MRRFDREQLVRAPPHETDMVVEGAPALHEAVWFLVLGSRLQCSVPSSYVGALALSKAQEADGAWYLDHCGVFRHL